MTSAASGKRLGRPTREQAEARQAELLERGLDMFLDKGFERTTMAEIAASLGMTKRTIYACYGDKVSFFKAVVYQAIARWMVPDETLHSLEKDSLEETLTAIAHMRIRHAMTSESLKLQRILIAESFRFPEIFTATYDLGSKPVVKFLAGVLEHHQAKGSIQVSRPHMAAAAFLSMVVGGPTRIIVSGIRPDPKEIEDRIKFSVELFLDGVRPR